MLKRLTVILFCLVLTLAPLAVRAEEAEARDITKECTITLNGAPLEGRLMDGNEYTYLEYTTAAIGVFANEPIGGVYVRFDRVPGEWTLTLGDEVRTCGTDGFLHEYQNAPGADTRAVLRFNSKVSIAEVTIYSKGALPANVQTWRAAEGPADIMIMPCRTGDEHLYFAGAVADAIDRGAEVQVCLFTEHPTSHARLHEFLNGLWLCGLDRYPVIGPMPDVWAAADESAALAVYEQAGYGFDDIVAYETELLRRFKPQIVLAHDPGEGGDPASAVLCYTLQVAVDAGPDAAKYPFSANKYGVWEPYKVYLHLYQKNVISPIVDEPLPSLGETAFRVSQNALRLHKSLLQTERVELFLGTEASPVRSSQELDLEFRPTYGLWRSLVGQDTAGTGLYEHIVFYADGGPLDPGSISQPTAAPVTAEPGQTGEPGGSAEPGETPALTEAPESSAQPGETPAPTSEAAPTSAPAPANPGKTLPAPVVVLILAAILAIAGVAMHFVIRKNLD